MQDQLQQDVEETVELASQYYLQDDLYESDEMCEQVAQSYGVYSYGVYSYGVYSYGVYTYGVYSYGLYSYGVYSYGAYSYGPHTE